MTIERNRETTTMKPKRRLLHYALSLSACALPQGWDALVTIDTKPSNLSAADKKAVEDAEEAAAGIED